MHSWPVSRRWRAIIVRGILPDALKNEAAWREAMDGLESVFCACEFRILCIAVMCTGTIAALTVALLT
jgi:hypothetical protein